MDATAQCPALPKMDDLPFAWDRDAAWKTLLSAGKVTVSDAGVYFLSAADSVEYAATHPDIFSSQGAFEMFGCPFPMVPLAVDRPEHTRYRRILDKFFGPRRMAERAPALRAQLGQLIEDVKASGDTCDVVSQLAVPFPSQVFLTLFGLPLSDRDRLIAWKDATLEFTAEDSGPETPENQARATETLDYLRAQLAARRGSDGEDLLSLLINDPNDDALTEQEIIGLCFVFILAGLDTVTSATGFALYELARNPELQERLRADESSIPIFIDEMLRVSSTAPYVPRKTTADVVIEGVSIPAGSYCWLGMGTANWDDARFAEPSVIHPVRQNHFAFGRGPHRCLGSHLARLELQLIIEEWNRRIPEYSLIAEPEIKWPNALLHFDEVHLRLDLHTR